MHSRNRGKDVQGTAPDSGDFVDGRGARRGARGPCGLIRVAVRRAECRAHRARRLIFAQRRRSVCGTRLRARRTVGESRARGVQPPRRAVGRS
eukprot:4265134-Prymnesium_polylepis.1